MADNTKQFRWIVTIKEGLEALFINNPLVFVAGDLFWYPVESHSEIVQAPDVMVAFGRPKGDRGSYQQWKEGGIAPQVVFEIQSPSNTVTRMKEKFSFYQRHGVEEYILYDPDRNQLNIWQRQGESLQKISFISGWVSPRLKVRFELIEEELRLYRPDGERFTTFSDMRAQREQAEQRAEQADQRAEQADQRAEQADQRAEQERLRVDRLAAQLRALGITIEGE
jgi:Uma2 family endonuclease